MSQLFFSDYETEDPATLTPLVIFGAGGLGREVLLLVQQLNQLQADAVSMADDTAQDAGADRRKRISSEHWHEIPVFAFQPAPATEVIGTAGAAFGLIGAWLLAALCMLVAAGRGVGVAR